MRWLILIAALLFAGPAFGSTVTFTDPETGEATNTIELHESGRFSYRIGAAEKIPSAMSTQSVQVFDTTGQLAPVCHPISDGEIIDATTDVVAGPVPVIMLQARAYSSPDCTGQSSIASNPTIVEFVPEAPGLLAPLAL